MSVIIFGAGGYGRAALQYYGEKNVAFFADNDSEKIGKYINGIIIISVNEMVRISSEYEIVIASSASSAMRDQLIECGLNKFVVFDPESLTHTKKSQVISAEKKQGEINMLRSLNAAYVPLSTNKPKTFMYVGCNTDNINFGCRATSTALSEILSKKIIISDILYRNEMLSMFEGISLSGDIFDYAAEIKLCRGTLWNSLRDRIRSVDAIVINGEGSFIFQSPPRADLYAFAVMMLICISCDTTFYVVNAMMSEGKHTDDISSCLRKDIISLLKNAAAVSVRDKYSYRMLENEQIRLSYHPDALFGWFEFYEKNEEYFSDMLSNPEWCLPFDCGCGYSELDFKKKYILFSGNSYAASHIQEAYECFSECASILRRIAEENDLNFFLIECCGGDHILKKISVQKRIPIITAETNIYTAGYILGHSECLISGRYHPSILASLGGSSCVFMDSNSHKTTSLQEVLDIDVRSRRTFSALPDKKEILLLGEYTDMVLKKRDEQTKTEIMESCRKNMNCAGKLIELF
ncbi:MAG: polysaccharide pyruvyl transferase family protein [Oscillospiraceae bacterium]